MVATLAALWLAVVADNLRQVVPGAVMRSAQPSPHDLARLAATRGLATVINLGTSEPDHDWLRLEGAACATHGVDLYSIGFIVDEWPPQYRVRELVHLLGTARRPILLHCRRGTDRTGWASAVARMLHGDDLDDALSELDLWHGHLCDPTRCPFHRFFASYQGYLERSGLAHSAATFRRWALEDYCPDPYDAELALEEPVPAVVADGAALSLAVRVRNRGREPWRMAAAAGGVRLGVRVIGPLAASPADPIAVFRSSRRAARDLARADAGPGELASGGERRLVVRFAAPPDPGLYILQVDMVEEQVHWFSDMGGHGILLPLEVMPPAAG